MLKDTLKDYRARRHRRTKWEYNIAKWRDYHKA